MHDLGWDTKPSAPAAAIVTDFANRETFDAVAEVKRRFPLTPVIAYVDHLSNPESALNQAFEIGWVIRTVHARNAVRDFKRLKDELHDAVERYHITRIANAVATALELGEDAGTFAREVAASVVTPWLAKPSVTSLLTRLFGSPSAGYRRLRGGGAPKAIHDVATLRALHTYCSYFDTDLRGAAAAVSMPWRGVQDLGRRLGIRREDLSTEAPEAIIHALRNHPRPPRISHQSP